jgi:adenylate cyclase
VLLSECLTDLGDPKAAEVELRSALSSARAIGSVRMETRARELLQQLGVEVEDAFTTPSRVEPVELGEKLVTVMFADVRGYTALADGKAPTELIDRVSTFHRWAAQEVARQHGVVDKFAGDAVMATFNVSGKEIDHALHALKAAVALRDKAAMVGLHLRIGIATGSAIIGQLAAGSNLSVVGETTNLASRLQAQSAAGEVMLSAEAHRRVNDWLRGQGIETAKDRLELKGLAEPVTAFRLKAPSVV